ncbi:NAD-dependent epimerase/dehydratase [Sulfuricurvum kujiense DSM 16994]|uniref:NAD-dependent epimerase/dehydratase n=1 Tax=Sulfuricurvum kujiense (strain ATCC BAA-921 / DSM 16994 / JCM 11577 / YK-1) TaxID=709032 RepID=E4U382_SULKY|nr:GDP-mannose 4,6-dehydratase [Sulfuricurvum kujiense]ADR34779.1 NAD-dependent epimerase/dehydratase [Sulfuricurvum kujiense DSM 16994]
MASASKRLLITGIESFTGKYIRDIFESHGYEVFGTVLGKTSGDRIYTCDITQADQIDAVIAHVRPDTVIHLAAITFVPDGNSVDIYNVNLFATLHLLDALVRHALPYQKVILPSTSNVYGNIPLEAIHEEICPQPLSHYALSKYAMEQMARNYFDRLPILLTRPFNYTGADQAERFVIPKIAAHYREKKSAMELGNIDVYRDFSDVRDVAEAYFVLAESAVSSEIFNIGSGKVFSLREIIEMAESASAHRLEIRTNPTFVRSNEIERLGGDNTRLKNLGWKPRHTMEETIRWMINASSL